MDQPMKLSKEYEGAAKTCVVMREKRIYTAPPTFSFGGFMRNEAMYQAQLIKKLERLFPDCFIMKNDPSMNQGLPDLLVLIGTTWFMLEVKLSPSSPIQPNQEFYVDMFNHMSFAAFICPDNEAEVLDAIQFAFGAIR